MLFSLTAALIVGMAIGYAIAVIRTAKPHELGEVHLIAVPHDALYRSAVQRVDEADASFPDEHHEAKRHYVFARLLDDYPQASRKAIARAIEAALED